MSTLGGNPKATRSIYYEYFFLHRGILIVRLLSPAVYLGIGFGWVLVLEALYLTMGAEVSFIPSVELTGLIILFLVSWSRVRSKKRQLDALDADLYATTHPDDLFQWSEVSEIELKGRKLCFTIQDSYHKVKLKEEDTDRVKRVLP